MNGINYIGIVANVLDGSDTLFMDTEVMTGLNALLASSTFTGTVQSMPPPNSTSCREVMTVNAPNIFSTDALKAIAVHLYSNESGIKVNGGVEVQSDLLDNVLVTANMTNR